MNVGFIGLGHMGSGMAANLVKAGHTVTVYNRTQERRSLWSHSAPKQLKTSPRPVKAMPSSRCSQMMMP
jgi:3-hydroxyisobutyrate dehydrogenase-like beta-hydroxyacid dehydrogenase